MFDRTVFFHEDDYCQIQLLPLQNWDHCQKQIGAIEDFSAQHVIPGVGWSDMYMRPSEPITLAALAIRDADLHDTLTSSLLPYDRVQTGYSSHAEDCRNTRGFGFESDFAVFYEYDDHGIVTATWLDLYGPAASEQKKLLAALGAVSQLGKLLYVDWGWCRLYALEDGASLMSYLHEREQRFASIRAKWDEQRNERAALLGESEIQKPWWRFW